MRIYFIMLTFETKNLFRHAHSLILKQFYFTTPAGSGRPHTTLSSVANKPPNHTQIQNQSKTNPKPNQNQPKNNPCFIYIPYNIQSTSKNKPTLLAGKPKTATNRPTQTLKLKKAITKAIHIISKK